MVDPCAADIGIGVVNYSENPAVLHVGANIGFCYSSYHEVENDAYFCASIAENDSVQSTKATVPEHEEKLSFASLLNKYQNVFAKTSEDLGRTNEVKHNIHTGDKSTN